MGKEKTLIYPTQEYTGCIRQGQGIQYLWAKLSLIHLPNVTLGCHLPPFLTWSGAGVAPAQTEKRRHRGTRWMEGKSGFIGKSDISVYIPKYRTLASSFWGCVQEHQNIFLGLFY